MGAFSSHRFAAIAAAGLVAGVVASIPVSVAAQPVAAAALPQEIDGQINGKKARFVAQGDDVLVSAAEADRLGLNYRGAKSLTIGGTTLWLVTLDSIGVEGRVRLGAPAGIVPSIPGYFAALRAHPAEAIARSREMQVEINGVQVKAYDLGIGGILVSPAEADRVGLPYRNGKMQKVGKTTSWGIETPVKTRGLDAAVASAVTVAEPEAFFEAAMSGAVKPR